MSMTRITLCFCFGVLLPLPLCAQVARSAPPPPLTGRTIAFPPIREARLDNGLQLIVIEKHSQPIVNIGLFVRSGSAIDRPEQAGRAGLLSDLLTKGTTTRSAREIAEAIGDFSGWISTSASDDWMSASLSALTEHVQVAFELLSDIVLNPTVPEDELESSRRRTLSELRSQSGRPDEIAQRLFLAEVYGEHAYGTSVREESVEGLTRDDLMDFHRSHFVPPNAVLVVSGDLTFDRAIELARHHFDAWRGVPEQPARVAAPPVRERTEIHLVDRPGSVQSGVWIGHLAVQPAHPDYYALEMMNALLGQGPGGRLFQILRQEKGWTYGAYSRLTRPREIGYFAATTEVRTEVTDSAVVEILHQLNRLRDEDVSAEEFEATKSFLVGSFPLRLETAAQIASRVVQARILGLDIKDVMEYRQRIAAVTLADVRRVAREHIRPDRLVLVVVGDATRIVEGLNPVAPIILYDVEGRRIERPSR